MAGSGLGWSLCPHQSFWLPHQRNVHTKGWGGAAMLTWPRENTVSTSGVELKKR